MLQTEDSSKHLPEILPVPERLLNLELPHDPLESSSQEIQVSPLSEPKDPLRKDNPEVGGFSFGSGPSEEQDKSELFAPYPRNLIHMRNTSVKNSKGIVKPSMSTSITRQSSTNTNA